MKKTKNRIVIITRGNPAVFCPAAVDDSVDRYPYRRISLCGESQCDSIETK